MATIPTAKYWTPAEVVTAANVNLLKASYDFSINMPTCRLYADPAAPPTFSDGVYQCIDTSWLEAEDNDVMHNSASAKWQLNFPTPGIYEISVRVVWSHFMNTLTGTSSNIEFSTNVALNNGGPANTGTMAANTIFEDFRTVQFGAHTLSFMTFGFTDYLQTSNSTDYLEMWIYQKTGAVRTLQGNFGGTQLMAKMVSTL